MRVIDHADRSPDKPPTIETLSEVANSFGTTP